MTEMRIFAHLLLAMLLLLAACMPAEKKTRMVRSDLQLQRLTGEDVDLSAYEGKTVFVNVWATWCRPCIQEMPTIVRAMEQLKGKPVVFLVASNEEVEEIQGFRDRHEFPFDYVRLINMEALSIEALPTTFIFDPSGDLIYSEEGFRDWSTDESLSLFKQSN